MSNKKKRGKFSEDDKIEQLERELRELKALNRSLMKRLKKVDREYHKALEQDEDTELEEKFFNAVSKALACPSCKEGTLKATPIGTRELVTCTVCKYRSTRKV